MDTKWSETWPTTVMGALVRPETYFGAAREITSLIQCAAMLPVGTSGQRPRRSSRRWPGETETAGPDRHSPVVLIHGYGHNHSGWWVMRKHLREGGFAQVETFDYSPVSEDIPATARRLAATVDAVRRRTGAPKVHIVGHSLGGLLARWYVQELDGAAAVDTVVTLGNTASGHLLPSWHREWHRGPAASELDGSSSGWRTRSTGPARCGGWPSIPTSTT